MIPWSETQTGNKVRFFRSDGDWEAKEVKIELIRLEIEHRLTTTDTPTSNAIAERMGGVLGEKAGAMLFEARLPEVMGGGDAHHRVLPLQSNTERNQRRSLEDSV